MTQKTDWDILTSTLRDRGLSSFEPFCSLVVNAFDGFPDLDEHETPAKQIMTFLDRSQDINASEIGIRFKHELSRLRAFTARAYAVQDGGIRAFNPLEQTYRDFASSVTATQTYFSVTPFPSDDLIRKAVEISLKS